MLRFDVETIYKATEHLRANFGRTLRFDVETIYKATFPSRPVGTSSCGLM